MKRNSEHDSYEVLLFLIYHSMDNITHANWQHCLWNLALNEQTNKSATVWDPSCHFMLWPTVTSQWFIHMELFPLNHNLYRIEYRVFCHTILYLYCSIIHFIMFLFHIVRLFPIHSRTIDYMTCCTDELVKHKREYFKYLHILNRG